MPERGADPWCCSPTSDARAKDLRLTARGWALLADVEEIYLELEGGWAATLGVDGVDGVESLRRDLEAVVRAAHDGALPPVFLPHRNRGHRTSRRRGGRPPAGASGPTSRASARPCPCTPPAFYDDMVNYEPTARIYRKNSDAAARRVHEMIDNGIRAGALRDVNGTFAAQVVALTIDAVQSRSPPAQHRTLRG